MAQSDDEYAAAENARRLRDAVKRGTIAAVKMNPPRCRVSFGGEHQSGWLQWFTHATSETRRLERTISGRSRYCCF
ncbi:hypothetical protein ACYX4F_12305 [Escherichia coli]